MPDSAAINAAKATVKNKQKKTPIENFTQHMEAAFAKRIMALTNSNLGM